MSSADGKGYLLPDGEAYTDVLRWFLVAVPDKPEYVRAAMGAYTEFTKWWTWQRDPEKRGADAADAWDEAVNATLEALEMGFPDILLGYIDQIEALQQTTIDAIYATACCNNSQAPGDDILLNTDNDGWPGSLPTEITGAGYTDDAAGRASYKCDAATAIIDIAANRAEAIGKVWNEYSGIAILGALIGLLAVIATGTFALVLAGIGTVIAATSIYGAIVDLNDGVVWDDLAADFATHKQCLAQAIVGADGVQAGAAAVKAYIDENFSTALGKQLAKFLLWEQWIAMLYAGRWGTTDFAALVAANYSGSDCTCGTIQNLTGILVEITNVTGTSGAQVQLEWRVELTGQRDAIYSFPFGSETYPKTGASAPQAALDLIVADQERASSKTAGDDIEFRMFNSAGSARNWGFTAKILKAWVNGSWRNVVGVSNTAGSGTWSGTSWTIGPVTMNALTGGGTTTFKILTL